MTKISRFFKRIVGPSRLRPRQHSGASGTCSMCGVEVVEGVKSGVEVVCSECWQTVQESAKKRELEGLEGGELDL